MTQKTIERDEASILQMKAGDRVWVGRRHHISYGNVISQPVEQVGPNFIFIRGLMPQTVKFHRVIHPRKDIGDACGFTHLWLLRIATPEECAAWDREQEAKAKEISDRNAAREAHDELLRSLTAAQVRGLGTVSLALVRSVSVRDSDHGPRGTFDIVVGGLTEDQVRTIRIVEAEK